MQGIPDDWPPLNHKVPDLKHNNDHDSFFNEGTQVSYHKNNKKLKMINFKCGRGLL